MGKNKTDRRFEQRRGRQQLAAITSAKDVKGYNTPEPVSELHGARAERQNRLELQRRMEVFGAERLQSQMNAARVAHNYAVQGMNSAMGMLALVEVSPQGIVTGIDVDGMVMLRPPELADHVEQRDRTWFKVAAQLESGEEASYHNFTHEKWLAEQGELICGVTPSELFENAAMDYPEPYKALMAAAELGRIRIDIHAKPDIIIAFGRSILWGRLNQNYLTLSAFLRFCVDRRKAYLARQQKDVLNVARAVRID
jgi:hypothetical protein